MLSVMRGLAWLAEVNIVFLDKGKMRLLDIFKKFICFILDIHMAL
jgi:hypothetical protein